VTKQLPGEHLLVPWQVGNPKAEFGDSALIWGTPMEWAALASVSARHRDFARSEDGRSSGVGVHGSHTLSSRASFAPISRCRKRQQATPTRVKQ
jgi:hypothetical protein